MYCTETAISLAIASFNITLRLSFAISTLLE